jgi:hypothetical protein
MDEEEIWVAESDKGWLKERAVWLKERAGLAEDRGVWLNREMGG